MSGVWCSSSLVRKRGKAEDGFFFASFIFFFFPGNLFTFHALTADWLEGHACCVFVRDLWVFFFLMGPFFPTGSLGLSFETQIIIMLGRRKFFLFIPRLGRGLCLTGKRALAKPRAEWYHKPPAYIHKTFTHVRMSHVL